MQAIKNNVIIKPYMENIQGSDEGYTTSGGIFIPIGVEEKKADKARIPRAIVIAIGPGVDEVTIGDDVIYNKFGAKELGPGYEDLFSININEVLGVVN